MQLNKKREGKKLHWGHKICCKRISSPTLKNEWRNIPFPHPNNLCSFRPEEVAYPHNHLHTNVVVGRGVHDEDEYDQVDARDVMKVDSRDVVRDTRDVMRVKLPPPSSSAISGNVDTR